VVSPKRAVTGSVIVPRTKSWERATGAVPSNPPTVNKAKPTKCADSDLFCAAFIESSNFKFSNLGALHQLRRFYFFVRAGPSGPGAMLVAQGVTN
jgi:hypothetical protein